MKDKDYDISLYNRSDIEVEGIQSKSLERVKKDIKDYQIVVVAAASENPFFDENDLSSDDSLIFDLAIPRNLPQELKGCINLNVLTLDELSGMVNENLKGRKIAGYYSMKDDLINAGAVYTDLPAVVDQNIITKVV